MTDRYEKLRYAEISYRIWYDGDFRSLSQPQPNAQSLFFYLLTNPRSTSLPGVLPLGAAAAAEELKWLPEGFAKAFAELEAKDMVRADWESRLVFLPNAIRHRPPTNPNIVIGWRKLWAEVPECALKAEIWQVLSSVKQRGEGFAKAFASSCPKPLSKVSPNQYQYQKQDQYLPESERASARATAPGLSSPPEPLRQPDPPETGRPVAASVPEAPIPEAGGHGATAAAAPQVHPVTPWTGSPLTKAPSKADPRAAAPPSVDEDVWVAEGLALSPEERREVASVHALILLGFRARWEPVRATIWPGPQGKDAKFVAYAVLKTARMHQIEPAEIVNSALDHWFADKYAADKRWPWALCRSQLMNHWFPEKKSDGEGDFSDPGVNTMPDELALPDELMN